MGLKGSSMPGFGDVDALDDYLNGALSEAAGILWPKGDASEVHSAKLFELFRDKIAGIAGLKHEQQFGLLTPEAIADQGRREAEGRIAAQRDAIARANGPQMTINGQSPDAPQSGGHATPGCQRGLHRFGTLRGPNGEGECLDCQTVFVCPP